MAVSREDRGQHGEGAEESRRRDVPVGFIEETPESYRNLVAVKKIGYPVAFAEAT